MKTRFDTASMFFAALLVLGLAGPSAAATWLGGTTNWNTPANWSGGAVPGNGDTVVIPNLAIDPVMPAGTYPAAGSFASFELQAGASNTCLGDTGVVNEASGGTVAVPHGIGVTINVSGNATIAGILDADTRGFTNSTGPGKGTASRSGASYGGLGGGGGPTYGSLTNPTALGSGAVCEYFSGNQGFGGGAIKLNVSGTLTVDGIIQARSSTGSRGDGSGGSIWLIANTFAGTGTVTADGRKTDTYSLSNGGGGGRIAIECQTKTFSGSISVAGGEAAGNTPGSASDGQPGTLWEPGKFAPGSAASPVNVTITNGYQYYFTNTTTTNYWNLTVDGAWVEFHTGSLAIAALTLTNGAILRFDRGKGGVDAFYMASLSITGSISIYTGGVYMLPGLYLPAEGAYNLSGNLNIVTGATLYAFGNTTNINAASGGTNGNPHGIGVTLSVGGDATIAGTLDADGLGFTNSAGPGANPPADREGGSYGGKGGVGGPTYGSLTKPTALGSGGQAESSAGKGKGGGAIKLSVAGALTVNGAIQARSTTGGRGEGSGGSIWLVSDSFAGTGTVTAAGRPTDAYSLSHGGGGGRVSIEYRTNTFNGSVSVVGGTNPANTNNCGQTGTWFQCQSPHQGTCATGYDGVALASAFSLTNNARGIKITRTVSRWGRGAACWTELSTDMDGGQLDNIVTNSFSGLRPSERYRIFDNEVLKSVLITDGSGGLSFAVTLTNGAHAIRVEGPAGTIVKFR